MVVLDDIMGVAMSKHNVDVIYIACSLYADVYSMVIQTEDNEGETKILWKENKWAGNLKILG